MCRLVLRSNWLHLIDHLDFATIPHRQNVKVRMVQGIWGVVPIYLKELSRPNFRVFLLGTTNQFGSLVSSASTAVESQVRE